jgi:hypothetical protein
MFGGEFCFSHEARANKFIKKMAASQPTPAGAAVVDVESESTCISEVDQCIPNWILNSEFVRQFKIDFPEDPVILESHRLFEFPSPLNKENLRLVLDNIRYFGIDDHIVHNALFEYFAGRQRHSGAYLVLKEFPELDEISQSVELVRKFGLLPSRNVKSFASNKLELNRICLYAARDGLFHLLRCAHEHHCDLMKDDIVDCSHLHLKCLQYLHEHGLSLTAKVCSSAARDGKLDSLIYARQVAKCAWDEKTCHLAAYQGHLDCLKYAHENGCPWNEGTCSNASNRGHVNCLIYAHENGCPWNADTCRLAVENDHLDCLKYALENGCPRSEETCSIAAAKGALACLKYAHENGCEWNEETCSIAAAKGALACLRYAHENGCPWNEETCSIAAHNGNLACLKYAHENGCPWNESTKIAAAKRGNLDCLKYSHENGCPPCHKFLFRPMG